MKKILCLASILALVLFAAAASATPYTIDALECEIDIPSDLNVVNETNTDSAVTLQLELNNRQDCGYTMTFAYDERYEGYYMSTLPDDLLNEIVSHYKSTLNGSSDPEILDISEGNEDAAALNPLFASGKNENGNWVVAYALVVDGWYYQVTGATTAEEFDTDSYGAAFNLFYAGLDLFFQE